MFTKTARFYDALYSFKDYRRESELILKVAGRHSGSLLDVACGTGKHLEFFAERFDCEGLDLDQGLLEVAADRLPGVNLHLADMTNFSLGKRFDVITCLFSAIGYVESVERLNQTLRCFAKHLNPGGVMIIEPWLDPSVWKPGSPRALFVDEPDLKIARMSSTSTDGTVSVVQFEYLIGTPEGVSRETEVHRLGLFSKAEYMAAFAQAGLEPSFLEEGPAGRGLYIGAS